MNRWLARHFFWPITERLRGRNTLRRFCELQRSERLSQEQLQELQAAKLQRILRIAAEHCPFYADRFHTAGLTVAAAPCGGRSMLDDLMHLPTLTRADVRANLEQMVWRDSPHGRPRRYTTGGSSGEPLIFYTDAARQAADWAARFRARSWWGIRPGDPEIWLWGAPVELHVQDRLRAWRDRLLNQEILSAFDMTPATMDAYIARIARVRPTSLFGYPSSLALLARHAQSRGLSPGGLGSPNLRAVFTTGEVLVDRDRKIIEEIYAAPTAIEYGCRDGGLIAYACPAGRLHVQQENCILELLDPQGQRVAPGEVGEVTVTLLETFAMPLIRYRNGDLARLAAGPCPCGRSSQTLLEVQGRTTDQIVCRDGDGLRRMHALSLMYVLREVEGLQQFRIVQPDLDHLEVSIVADARFNGAVESAVHRGLIQRMGNAVAITIHRCDHIPPTASGKHACVVSQMGRCVG
jgi:phenylacetate-CoA ligase